MNLEKIKQKILDFDIDNKIAFIVLFGSASKGTNNSLSDLDIAVFHTGKKEERFKFRMKLLGNLPDNVDLQIFQDLPLPVKKEVLGGKVIYHNNFQFVFDEFIKVIKEFESFKKYYHLYLDNLKEEVKV